MKNPRRSNEKALRTYSHYPIEGHDASGKPIQGIRHSDGAQYIRLPNGSLKRVQNSLSNREIHEHNLAEQRVKDQSDPKPETPNV